MCRKWYEMFREKVLEVFGDAYFDYEAFANVVGVVYSRMYGVVSVEDNVGYFCVLLLLVDMLNYGGDIVMLLMWDEIMGELTDMTIAATDNIAWFTFDVEEGVI